jgi:hypothetical protein
MKMRQAYLTRKAARLEVLNSAFYDRLAAELVCRTSRVEIMGSLSPSAGTGIDVSQIPDVVHGEVLQDSRGEGTLQKNESRNENGELI